MILIVDANILVSELLRQRGQALMRSPRLELHMTEYVLSEARHELRKRLDIVVAQGRLSEAIAQEIWQTANAIFLEQITVTPNSVYAHFESEARRRIPRDPNDWTTVALSLHLRADIWTQDYDFFGCGCATWTTETLLLRLDAA
jgi:predicted nucleic acid-binding protein